ncbi:phosphopantetheine-binding protein [Vibrio albus]|uniref:Phosphopantetheine-binding protein n=1 Tax=Vibrio albus TaxID=2200953 RepID=A0A2U3BBG7_9VIBR|nr:acyl carrier protein [Vibrio albus]PWI34142.1 phosphopantetheine-binding protein [Vibrio albus]
MNSNDIPTIIADALKHIAPEIEMDEIDQNEDLREECDLDSMDFLNLLASLKKTTGVSIPENDYPKVRSYNQLLNYLQERF